MNAPIVLLHGFTGGPPSWRPLLPHLSSRRVVCLTLYGHEPTAPPDRPTSFDEEVERIASQIRAACGDVPARVVGYSLGARVALGLLTTASACLSSAVLIGANPGLSTDEERRARAAADDVWIRLLEVGGIDAFVDRWESQPLFQTQGRVSPDLLREQRETRLSHQPRALALAMKSLGLASMPCYGDRLGSVGVPVELVAGEHDTKFSTLARSMAARLPASLGRTHIVSGAGHNVPLEQPRALAEIVRAQ